MEPSDDLLEKYDGLVDGIRLIRHAVDRAVQVGILSQEPCGVTPLEECKSIARSIRATVEKKHTTARFPWGTQGPIKPRLIEPISGHERLKR